MKVLTFDLEIRKEFSQCKTPGGGLDYKAMGISFGAAYLDWCNEYRLYGEENLGDLLKDIMEADVICGFNILRFDIPLLKATAQRLELPFSDLGPRPYDLFHDIKKSLRNEFPTGWKLDNVAKSNLSFCKNGDGADAPGLWKKGHLSRLGSYVIQDVKVEHALFCTARDTGMLKNDFTFPKEVHLNGIKAITNLQTCLV